MTRREVGPEAVRLTRILRGLRADEAEVAGLLSLMLLQDSRREARTGPAGGLVLLEDQDRRLWDRDEIGEGLEIVRRLPPGADSLQAALAAEHPPPDTSEATHWRRIVELYP